MAVRSPTAATASRRPRGAGRLRAARAARRAGASPASPRAGVGDSSCAPTPSRCSRPSPDRVTPPCPLPARAGAAAATGSTRRCAAAALKAAVVREQLARLAGLDVDVEVEPGARRRATGWAGARASSSRSTTAGRAGPATCTGRTSVVPVDDCPIAHPRRNDSGVRDPLARRRAVDVVVRRTAERARRSVPRAGRSRRPTRRVDRRRASSCATATGRGESSVGGAAASGRCTPAPPDPAGRVLALARRAAR